MQNSRQGSDAFGELYTKHVVKVRRLLTSVIGPTGDLDDLVQEVFLRAYRSMHTFRGDSSFSTWLHRISVRTAYSYLKSKKKRSQERADDRIQESIDDKSPNAFDSTLGRELARRLYDQLAQISVKRRVAFTLFEIEGRSILEIAQILDVPKSVAKSRIWFARKEVEKRAASDPYLSQLLQELEQ